MKSKTILSIVAALFCICACGPSITTNAVQPDSEPLSYKEKVQVIYISQPTPEGAIVLGTVNIDDTGFTLKCGFDYVIEQAVQEARKLGGNAIKITKHKTPDFWSSCHRITADIIKI